MEFESNQVTNDFVSVHMYKQSVRKVAAMPPILVAILVSL